MGDLVLKGATSGQITLTPTGVAGTNTLTLPARTGNIITSADTGTVTQAMLASGIAGNGPAFMAFANASQTLTTATFTKVQLNAEETNGDPNNCFDTTNYRFTPNVAGYYLFSWCCGGRGSTGMTALSSALYKNNSLLKYGAQLQLTFATNSFQFASGSALVYMNGSTDQVELWVYIVGTGTITTYAANDGAFLSGAFVRAA